MFDAVTAHALRLRRARAPRGPAAPPGPPRSSRLCSVCGREIALDEHLFLVHKQVHCAQCHGMLEFELGKEREAERDALRRGTKWDKGDPPERPNP